MAHSLRKEAVKKRKLVFASEITFSLLLSAVSITMLTSFKPCTEVLGCPEAKKIPVYCQ